MKELWFLGIGSIVILLAFAIATGYFTFSEFINYLQVEGMLTPIVFIFGVAIMITFLGWFMKASKRT
ncbi:hypothetical protein ACQKFO_21540 [Rossellomorea sp. NPDC071047]|uniref:hypothetical protein n=1 Tax=Rossellomorea sp. NPDC071047 TaxID=3390675 RepID=UPI003CFE40F4